MNFNIRAMYLNITKGRLAYAVLGTSRDKKLLYIGYKHKINNMVDMPYIFTIPYEK